MTPERVLLTLATLAFAVGVTLLMLRGWRSRQRRQAYLPPPPRPPAVMGELLVGPVPGLFIGTTFADDWLDRVAVHGLAHRAAGAVSIGSDGVRFDRAGCAPLYLQFDAVLAAELGEALAGKVIGRGGMLLVDWRLGDRVLTSGFRADDHDEHRRLRDAITARLAVPEDSR